MVAPSPLCGGHPEDGAVGLCRIEDLGERTAEVGENVAVMWWMSAAFDGLSPHT